MSIQSIDESSQYTLTLSQSSQNEHQSSINADKQHFTSHMSDRSEDNQIERHIQSSNQAKLINIEIEKKNGSLANEKVKKESFYIDQKCNEMHQQKIADKLLNAIQLLNYQNDSYNVLQKEFKSIVSNHLIFHQIFPDILSEVGAKLLQNGLFHEMWGNIIKKSSKKNSLSNYYYYYYPKLQKNHSNFQKAFNENDSRQQISKQLNEDSTTRLTKKKDKKVEINQKQDHSQNAIFNQSSKQNDGNIKQKVEQQSGRLRLIDQVQTNKRRLNAEMVCYFLGITRYYNLVDIQIDKVLEFYHYQNKQLLILQVHQPAYCDIIGKVALDFKPKILISMYGFVSFPQLLRVKQQYQQIQGFILYDELLSLPLWLNNNSHQYSQ